MVLFNLQKKLLQKQLQRARKNSIKKETQIKAEIKKFKELKRLQNEIKKAQKIKLSSNEKKVLTQKKLLDDKSRAKRKIVLKQVAKKSLVIGKKSIVFSKKLADFSADVLGLDKKRIRKSPVKRRVIKKNRKKKR